MAKLKPADVEGLEATLRTNQVVTYLGQFGTGGSQSTVFIPFELPNPSKTTLIYFRSGDAAAAKTLADICAQSLGLKVIRTLFLDYSKSQLPVRQVIVDQSGLDFQLVIQGL